MENNELTEENMSAWLNQWYEPLTNGNRKCRLCQEEIVASGKALILHSEYHQKRKETPEKPVVVSKGGTYNKSFSLKILSQMLADNKLKDLKSMEDFVARYKEVKEENRGEFDRLEPLLAPLGEDELGIMKDYFDPKIMLKDIAVKYQLTNVQALAKIIHRTSLKIVYQNREKLGL